jgi:hypothetical protein
MGLARLGRTAAARKALTEARILVELGLLDRQEGPEERAREQLEDALTIFRRLGAQKDMERVERLLSTGNRPAVRDSHV